MYDDCLYVKGVDSLFSSAEHFNGFDFTAHSFTLIVLFSDETGSCFLSEHDQFSSNQQTDLFSI